MTRLTLVMCLSSLFWACGTAQNTVTDEQTDNAASTTPPEPEETAEGEAESTTFRLAITDRPRSLDPGRTTDNQSAQIVFNTFEGLMAFSSGSGPVQPGLAERYTVSEDGRIYTFFLREGLTWSNGDPLTAADFEYSWKRVLNPKTSSEYTWMLTDIARIQGAEDFTTGQVTEAEVGIVALDDTTLQITLEEPVPYFIDLMGFATFMPIPRKAHTEGIDWTDPDTWVSSGPFILSPESSSRVYVLERNPNFWNADAVELDRVEVRVIEDDANRIAAFDSDKLDWTGPSDLPTAQIQNLAARPEFRQDPSLSVEYLVFNTQVEPLNQPKVREAIALAIDRDAIVISTLKAVGQPAYGFVPPIPGFSTIVRRRTNLERAQSLLAEAGFPEGAGFPKLTYLYPSTNTNARAVAEMVQIQLSEGLGIEVELVGREFAQVLDDLQRKDFQIARSGWIADFLDPASFLGLWTSDSQQNKASWSNADYDALMAQATRTLDRGERFELYAKAEAILDAELPVSPLYYSFQTYLLQPEISGFDAHRLNIHLLRYVKK